MTRQMNVKAATAETSLGPARHPQMKITRIASHVLQCEMPEELGYSQQFFTKRSAHIVEVETDEGITGLGETSDYRATQMLASGIDAIKHLLIGEDPSHITSRDGLGEASHTSRTPATLAVTAVMSTDDGSGNRPPGA